MNYRIIDNFLGLLLLENKYIEKTPQKNAPLYLLELCTSFYE